MKRQNTIALEDVKECMRRGMGGSVENRGGFSVYVDADGKRQYVVDDQTMRPVPFRELHSIRSGKPGVSIRAMTQI